MSQVIVEEDALNEKRKRSATQEHKIDIHGGHAKWLKGGEQGQAFIAKAVGMAVVPVAAIWFVLYAIGVAVITLFVKAFDLLGSLKNKRTQN